MKFSTISLSLTKLYVTRSFAIASSVTYSEIRQNLYKSVLYSVDLHELQVICQGCPVEGGPVPVQRVTLARVRPGLHKEQKNTVARDSGPFLSFFGFLKWHKDN